MKLIQIFKHKVQKISLKNILFFIFCLSISPLIIAYIAEYFFDQKPCVLCLYQRKIFIIIAAVSAFVIAFFEYKNLQKKIIFLSIFLLFANSVLALDQVGVEKKIFRISESCLGDEANFSSVEELKLAIKNSQLSRCDQPNFYFLTLSMAAWNSLYCFFQAFLLLYLLRSKKLHIATNIEKDLRNKG